MQVCGWVGQMHDDASGQILFSSDDTRLAASPCFAAFFCELTVCTQLLHAQILFLQDKPTAHLKLKAVSAFSTNSKNEFAWKHTLILFIFLWIL